YKQVLVMSLSYKITDAVAMQNICVSLLWGLSWQKHNDEHSLEYVGWRGFKKVGCRGFCFADSVSDFIFYATL
ncbi:TPA: hypothetical protein ACNZ88_004040, partial [Enterobacter kobei]